MAESVITERMATAISVRKPIFVLFLYKILFILLISFILGIIGTFVIVSLNYLILIAN